jgi:hypothetical protein
MMYIPGFGFIRDSPLKKNKLFSIFNSKMIEYLVIHKKIKNTKNYPGNLDYMLELVGT